MCDTKRAPSLRDELIEYTYPVLSKGKEKFVYFYAFNPERGRLCRKRIKVNFIKDISERKMYVNSLIGRIIRKLESGWNPFVSAEDARTWHTFSEVCSMYHANLEKQRNDGALREKTFVCYTNQCRMLEKWNASRPHPITYIFEFGRKACVEFLDYIYLERKSTPRTRNNYLTWLKTFSSYLTQQLYLTIKPTDGITSIRQDRNNKNRNVIPEHELIRLYDYLEITNPHYLLACYVLYYCLIRPKEMSNLKLSDFHIKDQTVFISAEFSKNRKNSSVTLPARIIQMMVDLDIFSSPGNYYLFSEDFKPGTIYRSEKYFSDYWTNKIRPAMKWGLEYKFYSLKDTGITHMLGKLDVLTVRDQARHSSINITNIYTPHNVTTANEKLKEWHGIL